MSEDTDSHTGRRGGRRSNQTGRPRVADPKESQAISMARSVRAMYREISSAARARIARAVEAMTREAYERERRPAREG